MEGIVIFLIVLSGISPAIQQKRMSESRQIPKKVVAGFQKLL